MQTTEEFFNVIGRKAMELRRKAAQLENAAARAWNRNKQAEAQQFLLLRGSRMSYHSSICFLTLRCSFLRTSEGEKGNWLEDALQVLVPVKLRQGPPR